MGLREVACVRRLFVAITTIFVLALPAIAHDNFSAETAWQLFKDGRTLGLVEAADEIEYGVKQEGCFEESTISKLVSFYRSHSVTFTAAQASGPGICYKPKARRG